MANGDQSLGGVLAQMPWRFTQAPQMAPDDRDALIKTIAGEAGDQGAAGQAAVAHVVLNRLYAGGYGDTVKNIVQAPAAGVNPRLGYHEFSVWNPPSKQGNTIPQKIDPNGQEYTNIGDIVDRVYNGEIPDPTNGATHYFAGRMPPQWGQWGPQAAAQNSVRIGTQTFLGGSTGPGQSLPDQSAGGFYDEGALSG
jgi:spore germination cell wall hydrolase CwlJ-like protein